MVLVVRTVLKRPRELPAVTRDVTKGRLAPVGWTFVYLMVILKLPIVALLRIVWWAIRQTPEEAEQPGGEGGLKDRTARPIPARRRAAAPVVATRTAPAPPVAAARSHDQGTRPPARALSGVPFLKD